jgi:hypothetical protein
MRNGIVAVSLVIGLAGCGKDRERQVAECVAIYRTTYVQGAVRDCLVQRYQWSAADAADAERDHLAGASPDSAARGDSARIGDSAGPGR